MNSNKTGLTERIMVTLSGRAYETLNAVQKALGVGSKAKIIRYALSLYFSIFKKTNEGYELCMMKGDEIRFFGDSEFLPLSPILSKAVEVTERKAVEADDNSRNF